MDRRHFCMSVAATVLTTNNNLTFASTTNYSQSVISLWPASPPGGGGPQGNMHVSNKGAQTHISTPILTVLTPASPNGRGILIAAGGGYKRIEAGKEAWPAAQWLVARGYTAYILSYRLPGEGWTNGNLVSLQDAQRALRIVRQHHQYVGVLGFSAGGHLLGMAATRRNLISYTAQDALDDTPAYADSAALIYPVVTVEKPYTHTSTHKILVGPHATAAEEAAWSVQHYVTEDAPPFFLVQAEDDTTSNPDNTRIMQAACERAQIPVEMHRYASGGHGFGMGRLGTPTTTWPNRYEQWLKNH
jgi:acetyl esterase/lipase